jgi:hypothetical protein
MARSAAFTRSISRLPVYGLVCALGAASCKSTPEPSSTPSATTAGSSAGGVAALKREAWLPGWETGERREYDLSLTSDVSVQGSPLTSFVLKERLVVTAIERSAERVLLLASALAPKLSTLLPDKQAEFAALEAGLAVPFLFEIQPGGGVRTFHFRDQPNALVGGIRQQIGALFQVSQAQPAPWITTEYDATGAYEVEYSRSEGKRLAKKKTRYVSGAPGVIAVAARVVAASGWQELSALGVPEAASISETTAAEGAQILPIQSKLAIELSAKARTIVKAAELPSPAVALQGTRAYGPDSPWQPATDGDALDKSRIAGRSLDQILKELQSLAGTDSATASEERQRAHHEAFAALEAMIRSQATHVPRLIQLARKGDPFGLRIIDALGSSGSPAAHAALHQLAVDKKLDATLRKVASIALSQTSRPTLESVKGLQSSLEDPVLGRQALYGLGTAVRKLIESGQLAQADQVMALVLERLAGAKTTIELVTALRAVANSGYDAALPKVQPHLGSANEEVRAAAVEALQLIHVPAAQQAIAELLAEDPTRLVREAACRAARHHTPAPALERAVVHAATLDKDGHVRLAAVRLLAQWLRERPSLRQTLTQVAASQKEEDSIRQEARKALGGA